MDPDQKIKAVTDILGNGNVLWVALKDPLTDSYQIYYEQTTTHSISPQHTFPSINLAKNRDKQYYINLSHSSIVSNVPPLSPSPGEFTAIDTPKKRSHSYTKYPDNPESVWPNDIPHFSVYRRIMARSNSNITIAT